MIRKLRVGVRPSPDAAMSELAEVFCFTKRLGVVTLLRPRTGALRKNKRDVTCIKLKNSFAENGKMVQPVVQLDGNPAEAKTPERKQRQKQNRDWN